MRKRLFALLAAVVVAGVALLAVLTLSPAERAVAIPGRTPAALTPGAAASDSSYGSGSLAQAVSGQPAPKAAAVQSQSQPSNDNLVLGNPPGDIERTVDASFVVPHKQFGEAFNQVISHAVNDEGGFVVSTTTSPDATGRMVSGTVVVKVPTAKLSAFLAALPGGMFTPSSINFATIDHTAEYIDDQARLNQAQQELDALLRALAATSDPATIASLTQQIGDAQQNLEKQQATFAVVQQAVALSTATIHLKESGAVAAAVPPAQPVLTRSTQSALNNDLMIASALVYAAITALPVLLLLLVLALSRRRILRAARAVIS
jgi:Domain of unknown function (DUF4349)